MTYNARPCTHSHSFPIPPSSPVPTCLVQISPLPTLRNVLYIAIQYTCTHKTEAKVCYRILILKIYDFLMQWPTKLLSQPTNVTHSLKNTTSHTASFMFFKDWVCFHLRTFLLLSVRKALTQIVCMAGTFFSFPSWFKCVWEAFADY